MRNYQLEEINYLDEPLNSLKQLYNKCTTISTESYNLRVRLGFLSLTHSGVATNGPELVTEEDRPMAFLSVRDVPGVLGGVGSPTERASTSLDSDSLAGLRTSFTDTAQTKMNKDVNLSCGYECDLQDNRRARKTHSF